MFHNPMSSPQMTRMLGFLRSAAWVFPPAPISAIEAVRTVRPYLIRSFRFIVLFCCLFCFLCPWRRLSESATGKIGEGEVGQGFGVLTILINIGALARCSEGLELTSRFNGFPQLVKNC